MFYVITCRKQKDFARTLIGAITFAEQHHGASGWEQDSSHLLRARGYDGESVYITTELFVEEDGEAEESLYTPLPKNMVVSQKS